MRILAIKLSSLGDLFHALPAVHNLKVGLDAKIDWVTQEEYVGLVRCFAPVDRVIAFSRKAFFMNAGRFLSELRTSEYDYIIDFQGLLKSALVAALARGKVRIGPSFAREGSCFFYSATTGPRDKNRHAIDENLDVVRYLKLEVLEPTFPVSFPTQNLSHARPRVALLPVSRWPTKTWPLERFEDVARQIREKTSASIFLLGGRDDMVVCAEIERRLGGEVVNMAGKCDLVKTGGLLKEMDVLIANDSGPVHMAAAVGTPAVVIFGPTDPQRTGPFGSKHRVVRTPLPCAPCHSRSCRHDSTPCITGVSVEMVANAALDILRGEISHGMASASRTDLPSEPRK